ncbi:CBY1-interacting BAR domain-containing protein 1-like isoform X2 [Ptychodera flava]|uniref:CBY1-interacting BAR domain-containing protein 1-like isoform X2 n=1 Tax=Ptychodera flava TaxID=63121 RepID=UPI003969E4CE
MSATYLGTRQGQRASVRSNASRTSATSRGYTSSSPQYVQPRERENQSKFVQSRIDNIEKHYAEICQEFASYTRKTGRLRDKGDAVAKAVLLYADSETPSMKTGLTGFAECLSSVQDYRNAEVDRLERKVVTPLTLYGTECKHAKSDLKASFAAYGKEQKQQKRLEQVRLKNPSDRHQISQAESELQKASVDATRSTKALEDEMDRFEKKKMQDIKTILRDFVQIEMVFHAKALEVYTQAFQTLMSISEDDDLEEFRNSLRPPSTPGTSRLDLVRAGSKGSLNSTSRSTGNRHTPSTDRRNGSHHDNHNMTNHDDDDDDEETDEDEDDSYYRS